MSVLINFLSLFGDNKLFVRFEGDLMGKIVFNMRLDNDFRRESKVTSEI